MENMKILLVSANYPNEYYLWAPWNKKANIAISKLNNIKTDIIAPLPYTIPLKYFPYNKLSKIPEKEIGEEGIIHRPKFLYLVPQKYFYGNMGESYKNAVSAYIFNNIDKPQIIHCHQAYPDGYGVMEVCKKWDVYNIVEIHSTNTIKLWLNHKSINNKFLKTLDFADKIICISKEIQSLIHDMGFQEDKIEYIPLGVNINEFKPRNKENIRNELCIKNEKIILFVGNLIKLKGINYLLESIYQLYNCCKFDFKLIIIGRGSEEVSLMKLSKKLGIEKIVKFIGPLSGVKLHKWYSLADFIVLPSLTEGRPMVIYEAMASECAVIATNVGGIPEQVKDGHTGFLVEPRNVNALTKKMKYLLENEEIMKKMGKNGRKRVIKEGWTWEGYGEKVAQIYRRSI